MLSSGKAFPLSALVISGDFDQSAVPSGLTSIPDGDVFPELKGIRSGHSIKQQIPGIKILLTTDIYSLLELV